MQTRSRATKVPLVSPDRKCDQPVNHRMNSNHVMPLLAHGSVGLLVAIIGLLVVANCSAVAGVALSFTKWRASGVQLLSAATAGFLGIPLAKVVGWPTEGWTFLAALYWLPISLGVVGLFCWALLKSRARGDAKPPSDDS